MPLSRRQQRPLRASREGGAVRRSWQSRRSPAYPRDGGEPALPSKTPARRTMVQERSLQASREGGAVRRCWQSRRLPAYTRDGGEPALPPRTPARRTMVQRTEARGSSSSRANGQAWGTPRSNHGGRRPTRANLEPRERAEPAQNRTPAGPANGGDGPKPAGPASGSTTSPRGWRPQPRRSALNSAARPATRSPQRPARLRRLKPPGV